MADLCEHKIESYLCRICEVEQLKRDRRTLWDKCDALEASLAEEKQRAEELAAALRKARIAICQVFCDETSEIPPYPVVHDDRCVAISKALAAHPPAQAATMNTVESVHTHYETAEQIKATEVYLPAQPSREELDTPILRCKECGGTQVFRRTPEGYETIHTCTPTAVRERMEELEKRLAEAKEAEQRWFSRHQALQIDRDAVAQALNKAERTIATLTAQAASTLAWKHKAELTQRESFNEGVEAAAKVARCPELRCGCPSCDDACEVREKIAVAIRALKRPAPGGQRAGG